MNLDLFSDAEGKSQPETILLPDADITLYRKLFSTAEADLNCQAIMREINWEQQKIYMFGKTTLIPRLTSWVGDPNKEYTYSGIRVKNKPWTPSLLNIKSRVEHIAETKFNSVLLNLYRNGDDCVAWHSDDEPELGVNPIVGSVSFGEARPFQLKNKKNPTVKYEVLLGHGDFLLMKGKTQAAWLHQVPRRKSMSEPRVNLTFRIIKPI